MLSNNIYICLPLIIWNISMVTDHSRNKRLDIWYFSDDIYLFAHSLLKTIFENRYFFKKDEP